MGGFMTKIVVCVCVCVLGASLGAAETPAVPVPTLASAEQTRASAAREWTLGEVLAAVLAQHPLVEAARARAEAARASRAAAGVSPNPVATYWSENSRFPGAGALPGVNLETSAYLTMPLEPFLQRAPLVRAADQGVIEADALIAAARRDAAVAAVRAFYRVALAQAAVDAARGNRDALEPLVSFSRTRVGEGAMPEVELLRVQVEFDRAGAEVGLAEADLARASAELRSMLGNAGGVTSPLDALRVAVPPGSVAGAALAPIEEFLTRATASRPELLSARARLAGSEAAIAYQRTLNVRQLGASFGLKRSAGQSSMIAGVSMAIPIFNRNHAGIARASGESRAVQQEVASWERTVAGEVRGAYAAAERLSLQVAALRPMFLRRAEEVHRITLGAYQEGGASLLQVLDASRSLADARLMYARTLFAARESILELTLASGTDPTAAVASLDSAGITVPGRPFDGGRQ